MRWLAITVLALGLAACSGDDTTSSTTTTEVATSSSTTVQETTTTAATYKDAVAVIQAINDAGLTCTTDDVNDNEPGGGAASVEFCTIGNDRIQVVTFANPTGKSAWLDLARQLNATCAVGDLYAACPDVDVTDPAQVAQRLADALGAEVATP